VRRTALALLAGLALCGGAAAAPVGVENASRPTRCAEEDNVYVKLAEPGIAGFRIVATHPPYVAAMSEDRMAPDFTACDMTGDPTFPSEPRSLTLYEDDGLALVGHAYGSFWRPERVPLTVAGRTETGLHLVQLFLKRDGARIEYFVLYPPDGYWRLKPLPPPNLPDSGYGSSFLLGPIEEQGRPLVRLAAIEFVPAERLFRLRFALGGAAEVRVARIERDAAELEISLDPPAADGLPFAAIRSMFVAPDNADAAETAWREAPGGPVQVRPILDPLSTRAETVRFGRSTPSRHNMSAPDLTFEGFRPAP
jgi:hypothetical protein